MSTDAKGHIPRKSFSKAQRRWRGFKDGEPDPVFVPEKVPGLKFWKKDGVVLFDKRAP